MTATTKALGSVLRKDHISTVRPVVVIDRLVHETIKAIHKDPQWSWKEWSCYCRLVQADNEYHLVEMRFPKQDNNWAHTEIPYEAKTEHLEWLFDNREEQMSEWCLWLHSHHNMWTFWSWEDYRTKADFDDGFARRYFSIVTSKKWGKPWDCLVDWIYYKGSLDIYKPRRLEFDLDIRLGDVSTEHNYWEYEQALEAAKEEFGVEELVGEVDARYDETIQQERVEYDDMEQEMLAARQLEDEDMQELLSIVNLGDVDLSEDLEKQAKLDTEYDGLMKDIRDAWANRKKEINKDRTDEKKELLEPYLQHILALKQEYVGNKKEDYIEQLRTNEVKRKIPSYGNTHGWSASWTRYLSSQRGRVHSKEKFAKKIKADKIECSDTFTYHDYDKALEHRWVKGIISSGWVPMLGKQEIKVWEEIFGGEKWFEITCIDYWNEVIYFIWDGLQYHFWHSYGNKRQSVSPHAKYVWMNWRDLFYVGDTVSYDWKLYEIYKSSAKNKVLIQRPWELFTVWVNEISKAKHWEEDFDDEVYEQNSRDSLSHLEVSECKTYVVFDENIYSTDKWWKFSMMNWEAVYKEDSWDFMLHDSNGEFEYKKLDELVDCGTVAESDWRIEFVF